MVEYSLLLGFIVLLACIVLTSMRTEVSAVWSTISSSFSSALGTAAS